MEETRTIVLDIYDYKLIINALNEFRNKKIAENVDTEIIDELINNFVSYEKREGLKIDVNFSFNEDLEIKIENMNNNNTGTKV